MWPARPVPCTLSPSLPLYLSSLLCWSWPRSDHGRLYPVVALRQVKCAALWVASHLWASWAQMSTGWCEVTIVWGERSVWGPWPSLCRSEGPAALSLATGFGLPLLFPDLVTESRSCCLPTGSLSASAWAPGHARGADTKLLLALVPPIGAMDGGSRARPTSAIP